jgi:hypothetical protein
LNSVSSPSVSSSTSGVSVCSPAVPSLKNSGRVNASHQPEFESDLSGPTTSPSGTAQVSSHPVPSEDGDPKWNAFLGLPKRIKSS